MSETQQTKTRRSLVYPVCNDARARASLLCQLNRHSPAAPVYNHAFASAQHLLHSTVYAIGVHSQNIIFIETPTFSRLIADLLDDDEHSKMQMELAKRPDVGDLIKNGGGIRKLR